MNKLEFLPETHQYLLNGELIPSVSEIIDYTLDEYSYVPKCILEKAAEYGNRIHEIIENWINVKENQLSDDELKILQSFTKVFNEHKLYDHTFQCELPVYTKDYAGTIDLVTKNKTGVNIYDIKTNRNYPEEHLKLQLNLYRRAYEKLNRRKIKELGCFWLNRKTNEFEFRVVEKMSEEDIDNLIINFKSKNKPVVERKEIRDISLLTPQENEILVNFYLLKNDVEKIEEKIKASALEIMQKEGIESFKNNDFSFSYVKSYEKSCVDSEKLKNDGIYEMYCKKVKVKDSVKIKFNAVNHTKR